MSISLLRAIVRCSSELQAKCRAAACDETISVPVALVLIDSQSREEPDVEGEGGL